jgi:hypothetical protein
MQISSTQIIIDLKDLAELTDWEFGQFWSALGNLVGYKRKIVPTVKPPPAK